MNTQKQTGLDIITVAEFQTHYKNTDSSLTGLFQTYISNASAICESYCNKGLKFNVYTDYYDGDNTNELLVNQYPIISISSLQYQLTPTSNWTDFYTGSLTANITPNNNAGIVKLHDTVFQKGTNNIKIEYTAGFSDCPGDLKQVVLEMVERMIEKSKYGEGTLDMQSISVNAGGFSKSNTFGKIEDKWEKTLIKYKRSI